MADMTVDRLPDGRAAPEGTTMLAADGTPLRVSLQRSLRRQKRRAFLLVAPLLAFILVFFALPIADMLFRSVDNHIVPETLPRTVEALAEDPDPVPGEPVFVALYEDLVVAEAYKRHTQLGTRLNYEMGGASSLLRGTGRAIGRIGTDVYADQFVAADPAFADPARWAAWMVDPAIRAALPETTDAYDAWARFTIEADNDDPAEEQPGDMVYAALWRDLAAGAQPPGLPAVDVSGWETPSIRELMIEAESGWGDPGIWSTLRTFSAPYTAGYYLAALDLRLSEDGIAPRPASERIYNALFLRTFVMSLLITGLCILLGYPVAFLLSTLPARTANLLMILVLLPFWTSLLVRTSAWKVLLQQQGVINDILVWAGLVADNARLVMINNQTGTIIAMTHILLPFMILPMYSVMKGIPPAYMRAARSLGANDWTAFWRVYFPQSIPGIGAGSILVFILAIGYYITPELVGGTRGVFISNRIAYHISSSLNWGLAAALGTILLVAVLILYWIYDRLVGIDNVKLGG
ncbi:ABC-type spermidine/putrescine transport system, permease component I [Rubellimicrobium thermophilum DSM 16684]|uniref:ABC-type spermidine/putrescine transport system, permease component I n=1 Tax=Rubellimicrobium thermophilum DSM 16684 TaxID=1123069 RepID=S9QXB0_9RHOB|nr:ABC transporter permease [Rubellimicrobium thermophilum]EPX84273.1 ABC-type spermidine/putrescine transport system, permease component I [Rubellimicrobium thermophilum DSM 16684]